MISHEFTDIYSNHASHDDEVFYKTTNGNLKSGKFSLVCGQIQRMVIVKNEENEDITIKKMSEVFLEKSYVNMFPEEFI